VVTSPDATPTPWSGFYIGLVAGAVWQPSDPFLNCYDLTNPDPNVCSTFVSFGIPGSFFSLNDAGTGQSGFYISQVDVDTRAEERNITYYTGGTYYYYPAVAVNNSLSSLDPYVGVALSWSSNDVYPSGAFKLYQNFTVDASGTFFWTGVGTSTYNVYYNGRNRWGDYLGIARDWSCGTLWGLSEYAPALNVWRTRISQYEGPVALPPHCRLIFDDGFERNSTANWD